MIRAIMLVGVFTQRLARTAQVMICIRVWIGLPNRSMITLTAV